MEKAKRVFKCISVFAATYCALLNAVVADNRYFKVFAVLSAVFEAYSGAPDENVLTFWEWMVF